MRRASLLVLALVACGGPSPPVKLGPTPARETRAPLAGARCSETACRCRAPGDDVETEPPAEGTKRFEIRIGRGPGLVWVTVDTAQQLFVSTEVAEACFYIDLVSPGRHDVVVRGRAARDGEGVGASVEVKEYGGQTWWYDTAVFQCGFPGPCEPEKLKEWKAEVDGYPRSLRDPCGSTKVRGAQWTTGRLPDGLHPDEFAAAFALQVYPFAPKAGPGDCPKAQ